MNYTRNQPPGAADSKRPKPPYGAIASRCIEAMPAAPWTVWISQDWGWQNSHPYFLRLVIPPNRDPRKFDWQFLRTISPPVLIRGSLTCQPARLLQLTEALERDGIAKHLAIPPIPQDQPEVRHAA